QQSARPPASNKISAPQTAPPPARKSKSRCACTSLHPRRPQREGNEHQRGEQLRAPVALAPEHDHHHDRDDERPRAIDKHQDHFGGAQGTPLRGSGSTPRTPAGGGRAAAPPTTSPTTGPPILS